MFPGALLRGPIPAEPPRDIREITLLSGARAWWERAPADRRRGLIYFAHGNAELISDWPLLLSPYVSMGFDVFLPEYRGFGGVPGPPIESDIVADFIEFYDRLLEAGVSADRIIYHGRSIGGGAVCALGQHRTPRATILQSTFTSVADVARAWGVPRTLLRGTFDNRPFLKSYSGPLLVMHGQRDRTVPVGNAHAIAELAPHAELRLFDVGHNEVPMHPTDYWTTIRSFLDDF